MRRCVVVGLVGLLVALTSLGVLRPAASDAATTYRYWTYWWGENTGRAHTGWVFAGAGPATEVVHDTDVVGWRFATTSSVGSALPRASATYDTLCPGHAATSGNLRLALVLDYGDASDWPPGETPPHSGAPLVSCISVGVGAHVSDAMAALNIDVRTAPSGLICGLNGFPATECAPAVTVPTPTPSATTSRTPTPHPSASRSARPTASPSAKATATPSSHASADAAPSVSPSASAHASSPTSSPSSTVAAGGGGIPHPSAVAAPSTAATAGAVQPSHAKTWLRVALLVGAVAIVVAVGATISRRSRVR